MDRRPCPAPTPAVCPQICPPAPPPPPCRVKPPLRGLHWAQTMSKIYQGLLLACVGGLVFCAASKWPRAAKYEEYYRVSEFGEQEDQMARKGLFNAAPKESLMD